MMYCGRTGVFPRKLCFVIKHLFKFIYLYFLSINSYNPVRLYKIPIYCEINGPIVLHFLEHEIGGTWCIEDCNMVK